ARNPAKGLARSQSACEFEALAQQFLDLLDRSAWVLPANSQSRHFIGDFVQPQRNRDPLLAVHGAIAKDLEFQRGLRRHRARKVGESARALKGLKHQPNSTKTELPGSRFRLIPPFHA